MTTQIADRLKRQLADLDRRINARIHQLRDKGEFSAGHEAFVTSFRKRQDEIDRKVDLAAKGGMSWDLLTAEFERDFHGLFDQLLRWEEHLDASSMKKH